jgi:folate-binding protein YgfZ
MPVSFLPDRGVVKVTGPDARGFLNNLLTSAIDAVAPEQARYAALLSPQGKVLFDFIVSEAESEFSGGFHLDCRSDSAPDLVKRLAMYRLRARLEIADVSDSVGVLAFWGGERPPEQDGVNYRDPRLPELGERMLTERQHAKTFETAEPEVWHAHRIGLGVPEAGLDFAYGDVFPHEIDMDQLHGVDFDKGCYVGQEVVSRMQHRGTARTRIVPVALEETGVAHPGAEIFAGGKTAGHLGSTTRDGRGLALVRLDRIEDALAEGHRITVAGIGVTMRKPVWARFAVPGCLDAAELKSP